VDLLSGPLLPVVPQNAINENYSTLLIGSHSVAPDTPQGPLLLGKVYTLEPEVVSMGCLSTAFDEYSDSNVSNHDTIKLQEILHD
jgi:hypothetical protein